MGGGGEPKKQISIIYLNWDTSIIFKVCSFYDMQATWQFDLQRSRYIISLSIGICKMVQVLMITNIKHSYTMENNCTKHAFVKEFYINWMKGSEVFRMLRKYWLTKDGTL